jgi:hypothetical protein
MFFYIILSLFNLYTFCTEYYAFMNTQNDVYCSVREELPTHTIDVGPCFILSKIYKNMRTERNSVRYSLDSIVLTNKENPSDTFCFKFGENSWSLPNSVRVDKAKVVKILEKMEKITSTDDKNISSIISYSNPILSRSVKKSKSW